MADPAITIRGLTKSYGEKQAVRGIDLDVQAHEVLAVLGPNGAGKTTMIEILEGYRERSSGTVEVLGVDPANGTREWRGRLGIVPQDTALQPYLTVRESLELYAGYFPASRPVAEVVGLIGLEGQEKVRAGRLSGGQKRRLDVGIALVGNPDLLFLDEPTTGFDPSARRQAWDMVSGLRDLGKTIVLTTHYMDEAERLADLIHIVDHGRLIATGTPLELTRGGTSTIRLVVTKPFPQGAPERLQTALGPDTEITVINDVSLAITGSADHRTLAVVSRWCEEQGVLPESLHLGQRNLEDVFLELTGRGLDDE